MNAKVSAIYEESVLRLSSIYDPGEAQSVANIFFEDLLHISRIQRLTDPDALLTPRQKELWQEGIRRLLLQEPVQYIVGHANFYGRRFLVSKDTLIPRPETEELVSLILRENDRKEALRILDAGTGTGCIAISLDLGLKDALVTGWDISTEALAVARRNAETLKSSVLFEKHDVLNETPKEALDLIVSNPPYIPHAERAIMHANVVDYEPGLALFVPDTDPLIFYRRIARVGLGHLAKGGLLYFEIHENFGESIPKMLWEMGYSEVRVFKDLHLKDRMVRALKV